VEQGVKLLHDDLGVANDSAKDTLAGHDVQQWWPIVVQQFLKDGWSSHPG
jgi:hypothetical protein